MRTNYPIRESLEKRFWKKVKKTDGCWIWTSHLDKNGRGHISLGRNSEGMTNCSRASWIVHFGSIPDGLFVLHKCDNGACVRPDHLFLGTQTENLKDMYRKGRHPRKALRGEENPCSKLNWDSVRKIREKVSTGTSLSVTAKQFGTSKRNVLFIVQNKTWKE